jgi:serine/threonine protein kinase/WD40 repeat protein
MTSANEERDPFEEVAESFLERYRAGERPSVAEYVDRYPQLAEQIRNLLPALLAVENAAPKLVETRPAAPAVPERLGEYRILREIGRGGMGVVYLAVQEALGRAVALKVLPFPRLLEPTLEERFRREAQAAARLHHHHIVQVFGVGEQDGLHYYAMQYIHGQGLDRVLQQVGALRADQTTVSTTEAAPSEFVRSVAQSLITGSVAAPHPPPSEDTTSPSKSPQVGAASDPRTLGGASSNVYYRSVARIGVQAAEALAYAHRLGILHRDIKPSNLLLDAQGDVWITDFGLAKIQGGSELTRTGDVVGTLHYMAPERFDGVSDPRGDVYGLGMTLYELLALRPAFADTNPGRVLLRLGMEEPPPLRQWDPKVPRDLETIVLKAIAREPERRYQTASDLADDLARFLAGRPIQARRVSRTERVLRWCLRNPVLAGLSAAVAVLLVVLGAGFVVTSLLRQERDKAFANQQRAERAEREVEFLWYLLQARSMRRSGGSGQRFQCLDRIGRALQLDPSEESRHQLRIEAIGALALPDLHLAKLWPGFPPGSVAVDFDDRLDLYARTDQEGNCSICQVADEQQIVLLPGWGKPTTPRLSRNGRFVAVLGTDGRLQVWKLVGSRSEIVLEESADPVTGVEFRADDRWVALGHQDGAISVFELATGQRLHRLKPSRIRRECRVALHPREPLVAVYSYFEPGVQLRDLRTGAVLAEVTSGTGFIQVAWSPDGQTLAAGGGDTGGIFLYDRQLKLERELLTRSGGMKVAFNHAGDRLASVGWGGVVQLWDVLTGKLLFTYPGAISVFLLRFSQDDQRLAGAISGKQLGIWKVGAGRDFRTLARDGVPADVHYFSAAVSPKQPELLAVGMTDGLGFWNLDTGERLHLERRQGDVRQVLFEPSGTLLTLEYRSGVHRWVIPADFARRKDRRLEPPQQLTAFPSGGYAMSQSRDGGVLAVSVRHVGGHENRAGIWIHRADQPEPMLRLADKTGAAHVAVSRDGRRVAAGVHFADTLEIWDTRSGQLVRKLDQGGGRAYCQFSLNGQWLATGLDGNRVWAVDGEPWREGARLQRGDAVDPVFSPDSKIIAHDTNTGTVRLVEVASGREVAQLPDPRLDRAIPLFTPDGTRLITLTNGTVPGIHVWDLRSIRQELATLGLDWK